MHPRYRCRIAPRSRSGPWRAGVLTADLRGAIGFSSFAVLAYYAIANASAWTLGREEGRPPRFIPVVGMLGCAVLAFALPMTSVLWGAAVLCVGAALYWARRIGARKAGVAVNPER